jgi:hypothetical protein
LLRKLKEIAEETEITKTWQSVRKQVLPRLSNYFILTRQEFYQQCDRILGDNKGVENDYYSALVYLNSCGELICFKEHQELANFVFPKPVRLLSVIYKILSKEIKDTQKGEFSENDVQMVLRKQKIPVTYSDVIIKLLKVYELIFEKPENPEVFIAPQYLQPTPYQGILKELLPASLILNYGHFMPIGLIGRFISRYMKDDVNAQYWKRRCI